jgi:hemolysin activation/secretion protein
LASLAQAPLPADSSPVVQAAAAEPRFDIWEYEIEGNTVLSAAQVERAVQPHLGPQRGMSAVEAARSGLEALYQQLGYLTVLVDIPEQSVQGGVVRLLVVEGRVGSLYVSGSKYHSHGVIRSRVTELAPGQVPDFNRVQRQLATVNRSEDRRVQPVIKPGSRPGTIDVDLQVSSKLPLSGSLEFNNDHPRDTDPLRSLATLRYDNFLQRDNSLSLTYKTAPLAPAQSRVMVLSDTIPTADGQSWSMSLTNSDSDVETLGGTQAIGNGTTWGLRRTLLLPRGASSAEVTIGADLKHLLNKVGPLDPFPTPLHYLPFQIALADQWEDDWGRLQLNTTLVSAWRQLFRRHVQCLSYDGTIGPQDQFACARSGGDGTFAALRWDLRWMSAYSWGSPSLRLTGQLASGPLTSGEQFSIGGSDTVRGYYESAASGDHGLLISAEWKAPNLAPAAGEGWREIRPLIFVDAGRVMTIDALVGSPGRVNLWSAGAGLRWNSADTPGLEGGIDAAWPHEANGVTPAGVVRLHARLRARF